VTTLLDELNAQYGRCATYEDRGRASVNGNLSSRFRTRFVRGDLFEFEVEIWWAGFPSAGLRLKQRQGRFEFEAPATFPWYLTPRRLRTGVVACMGASSGASWIVPTLLMPELGWPTLARLRDVQEVVRPSSTSITGELVRRTWLGVGRERGWRIDVEVSDERLLERARISNLPATDLGPIVIEYESVSMISADGRTLGRPIAPNDEPHVHTGSRFGNANLAPVAERGAGGRLREILDDDRRPFTARPRTG